MRKYFDEYSEKKSVVDDWIKKVLTPTKRIQRHTCTFYLRNFLGKDANVMLRMEDFNKAMSENGFKSAPCKYSYGGTNLCFSISKRYKTYHSSNELDKNG